MISKIVRFWSEPVSTQGQSLLDTSDLSGYKFYTFLIVSSPWEGAPDGGVASIVLIATDSVIKVNLQTNHAVLRGGELAAYQKALSSLKSIPELSALKYSEHENR